MPHSYGYRARTRHLFARPFRQNGQLNMTNYLTTYKIGDFVDIRANGAIHKGMPYKYYHGRTGRVWNVTPRAVGVVVNKRVRGRILAKRIHVRIEHVQKSRCRENFVKRVKENQKIADANKKNPQAKKPFLKRGHQEPRPGYILNVQKQGKIIESHQ
jgi:large subunit ribosomal protein L21e